MIKEKYYCDHCYNEIDYQTYDNTRIRFQYKGCLFAERCFCNKCWEKFWEFVNEEIPKK